MYFINRVLVSASLVKQINMCRKMGENIPSALESCLYFRLWWVLVDFWSKFISHSVLVGYFGIAQLQTLATVFVKIRFNWYVASNFTFSEACFTNITIICSIWPEIKKKRNKNICEMGGLHSNEDFDCALLSCDTIQSCVWIPTTLRTLLLLPILSQSVVFQLHYVTTQKTTIEIE